jgi:hypothetical protein
MACKLAVPVGSTCPLCGKTHPRYTLTEIAAFAVAAIAVAAVIVLIARRVTHCGLCGGYLCGCALERRQWDALLRPR